MVTFSLALNFNETAAMDSKQFRYVYILHLVDHATRLSVGAIIQSYFNICILQVIINKIFKYWITLFGTPNFFLSDNGGEFNNNVFRELDEQLHINIKTTVAESPWSNGIIEKQWYIWKYDGKSFIRCKM